MYCYLEFKLKNMKLSELFESIVLQKNEVNGFALFKGTSLIKQSLSKLGDFTVKKLTNGNRNLHITENRFVRNKMGCVADNSNCMCHTFLDFNN